MKGEEEESKDEDSQSDASDGDEEIPPTDVARDGTTIHATRDGGARGKSGIASVFGNESESDHTGDDHSEGLPEGEKGEHVSFVLREEFEDDQGIDRDLS